MTAAAAVLRTNVATVSRRIERAGEDLGSPLFHKEGGAFAVTSAGRSYILIAEEFEANLRREENNLSDRSDDKITTINLAAPPVIVSAILLPALSDLMTRERLLNVTLTNRTNGLGLGDADIFIRWGAPETGRLVSQQVGSMSFGAYRRKSSTSQDWAALACEHDRSPIAQLGFQLFDRPPRLRADIFDHKLTAMRETGLGGIAPDIVGRREPEFELIPQHIESRISIDFWYTYHASRREDATLQKVLNWLCETVANANEFGLDQRRNSGPQASDISQF